ncbi:MAG: hypothetical protein O2901_12360 [Verrucomicrobia bacterium]|nr:hypothetical protein [Verrucomicrobiota bacterium]
MLMVSAGLAAPARAAMVTIRLVAPAEGELAPVEERQRLWRSPFGGWGVTAWTFAMRLDDTPILEYRTAELKLLENAMEGNTLVSDGSVEAMLNEAFGLDEGVKAEELISFSLTRQASETINVVSGRHTIQPFGIEFTLASDGTLATGDARARIDSEERRVDVICHPVTVKLFAGKRSAAGRLQLSYASKGLTGGFKTIFSEYDKQSRQKAGTAARAGFRRLILYLPASAPGVSYEINRLKFELDTGGRVTLAKDAKGAVCVDGREIHLQQRATRPEVVTANQLIGVSWFGAAGEVSISCGTETVVGDPLPGGGSRKGRGTRSAKFAGGVAKDTRGAVALPVPGARTADVTLGSMRARLPAATDAWPHRQLVWDVAGAACWAFQTGPLETRAGAQWSCRITRAAGKPPELPPTLRATLEAVCGGATGGDMDLKGEGGVFTGTLPARPGL